jgi:GNAT superfamily N-acetyltransferase
MSVSISIIKANKKDFLALLLLGDEQEDMIDRYLERGDLFVLRDGDVRSVCVVTREGEGVFEIKNLATDARYQGQGYGARLVRHVCELYGNQGHTMLVGTGESPQEPLIYFIWRRCFTFFETVEDGRVHSCFKKDRALPNKITARFQEAL